MDITHDNVCSSMLSCLFSYVAATQGILILVLIVDLYFSVLSWRLNTIKVGLKLSKTSLYLPVCSTQQEDGDVEMRVEESCADEKEVYRCEECGESFTKLSHFMDHRNYDCMATGKVHRKME